MERIFEKELFLRCSCGEPFDVVVIGWSGGDGLYIGFRAFHGNFWQRLKTAWKLLHSGYIDSYPDWVCISDDVEEMAEKIKSFFNEIETIKKEEKR